MHKIYSIMGVCPQFDVTWPDLTVAEHLLFYCRLKGVPASKEDSEVTRMINAVRLDGAGHKKSRELSGGMRRRLSLAISLIGNPQVVFLDEPTTGLDPETKTWVHKFISDMKGGRCIVLTTHSMQEADALCNRIGIMSHGKMRCLGTNEHLKNKFGSGVRVTVTFDPVNEGAAIKFMQSVLVGAREESRTPGKVVLVFQRGSTKMSTLFEKMQQRPKSAGIREWGLQQTTLEEVFLKIARESEELYLS
jgi:ABC-type multidrug transport system ATPase subunit